MKFLRRLRHRIAAAWYGALRADAHLYGADQEVIKLFDLQRKWHQAMARRS